MFRILYMSEYVKDGTKTLVALERPLFGLVVVVPHWRWAELA